MNQLDAEVEKAAAEQSDEFDIESVRALEDTDPTDPTKAQFVGMVAIIATVTVSWIAARMADSWVRGREQGVQIDLRQDPPVISRIAGAPMGYVVIVHQDGKVETQKVEYDSPEMFEKILANIVSKG